MRGETMSSKKTSASTIEPATEADKKQIWAEYERFYLTRLNQGHSQAHLYHNCISISTQDVVEKPVSVFPVGYKKVCENCLYRWREGDDGAQD